MAKRKNRPQGVVVHSGNAPNAPKAAAGAAPSAAASSSAARPEGAPPQAAQAAKKAKKRRRTEDAAAAASSPSSPEPTAGKAPGKAASVAEGPPPPRPWDPSVVQGISSAEDAVAWLVWPLTPAAFFSEYWEKKPLHLRRKDPRYYEGVFSKADVDRYLREGAGLAYGERINLARYDNKAKQKVELNGGPRGSRAPAEEVDAAWRDGSSIQVMHPQQFHAPAWGLLAALERGFGALFGANSYLTPPGFQGFAPHFDDVEVFMLQVEGSKRWRLTVPPEGEEYPLARDYSRDYDPSELGEQLLDCTVEQGDLLYLPRGVVHYGVVQEGPGFSHHLTVSTYQKTAWCQLLEKALSSALERAASTNPEFRTGLPVGFLNYMGSWHDGTSGADSGVRAARAAFSSRFRGLFSLLQEYLDLDEVGDELGVDFMAQRLPPFRPPQRTQGAAASSAASKPSADVGDGADPGLTADTRVRWLDSSAVRMMLSTDPATSEVTVMLFHSCGNERTKHMCRAVEAEEDVGCLRFEAATFLPALRVLSSAGAQFVRCGDLPLADEDDRVALCESLRDAGLLELAREGAGPSVG